MKTDSFLRRCRRRLRRWLRLRRRRAGVGFGDGAGVGFGGGGAVEDFFGGSEDSVDGEGDYFFFVGAVFLEAGGLVVFFLVVEEASSQVMVTACVAVCRSVLILGIPVSLVAFSVPTSEAGSR